MVREIKDGTAGGLNFFASRSLTTILQCMGVREREVFLCPSEALAKEDGGCSATVARSVVNGQTGVRLPSPTL